MSDEETDPVEELSPADQAARAAATARRASRHAALLTGTAYRYLGPLGRGGMGEVIEAEHIALGKRVVVKLLHAQFADRPDLVDRMRVEAQALARLVHQNLVTVSDFGQTPDGRTYLVMERLYGRTLRDELKSRGALPVLEAIDFVRQALAGLAVAHEAGIVHRDVKLDNLFVCDPVEGRRTVKLLDFGIAKVVGGGGAGRAPAPLAFPTEEGVAVGTPRFFSPEQARGQRVDPRTDVYAMGIVLYTLVAGRGPFDHINAMFELTRAHAVETPAPPSTYAAQHISKDLELAILKAVEKRPDDRFQSAAAFSAALGQAAAEIASRPPAAERQAVLARATVRMPELAEQQDAERRALTARNDPRAVAARGTMMLPEGQARPVAPLPAAGRPPEIAPAHRAPPPEQAAPAPPHPYPNLAELAPRASRPSFPPARRTAAAPTRPAVFVAVILLSALVSAGVVALLLFR